MYMQVSFKSVSLIRAATVHVLLPYHDGYPDMPGPWPTLYLLNGYSGNGEELATALPLRRFATEYGMAIVMPDGENSFYQDYPERRACYSQYVQEVVNVTREMFSQLSKRHEETFIGGISMGGYGALVNGLRWHDLFSKIIMFSPAADPLVLADINEKNPSHEFPKDIMTCYFGGREAYASGWMNPQHAMLSLKASGASIPAMFMCCGEQDPLVLSACKGIRDFMHSESIPLTYMGGEGVHDLFYWDKMLKPAFDFLKGDQTNG